MLLRYQRNYKRKDYSGADIQRGEQKMIQGRKLVELKYPVNRRRATEENEEKPDY